MNTEDKLNKLKDVWEKTTTDLSNQDLQLSESRMYEVMGQVFCPGPFYFYVFDFTTFSFLYMHPTIEALLGIKPGEATLDGMLGRLHPDDLDYIRNFEAFASQFFHRLGKAERMMRYKVSYSFRIRDKNDQYRLLLHQARVFTLDEERKITSSFAVHADISHLMDVPNQKLSLIDLDGEQSYLGLDIAGGLPNLDVLLDNPLTKREVEIVRCLAEGNSDREISELLFIAQNTVRTHRNNIRKKLDCKNTAQLVALCIRNGLI